jgi:hypothetical protein
MFFEIAKCTLAGRGAPVLILINIAHPRAV